jgi:hypothetical protein
VQAIEGRVERMKRFLSHPYLVFCSIVALFLLIMSLLYLAGTAAEKEAAENEPSVSVKVSGSGNPSDVGSIGKKPPEVQEEELQYFDSIEEALEKTQEETDPIFDEYAYMRKIDHMIKSFENEQYAVIFYLSYKNEKTAGFNACTIKKRETREGKTQYALMTMTPTEWKKNSSVALAHGGLKGHVERSLVLNDYKYEFNVDEVNARFIWGGTSYSEINTLKIEGQKPTEVIPYKAFGKTEYFWYYADLKSDKLSSQLKVEVDEPKE